MYQNRLFLFIAPEALTNENIVGKAFKNTYRQKYLNLTILMLDVLHSCKY
jgi:hypothetical protein